MVGADLDEKSYIKTITEDNKLKNHKLDQTLKQKQLKKEVNASFRNKGNKHLYKSNFEQLAKLEVAKSLLEIGSVCRLTKKIDVGISKKKKKQQVVKSSR